MACRPSRVVRQPAELDSTLDRLVAESAKPILIDIRLPGFIVQIGIALDPTFVVVNVGHENDGEYLITVGHEQAEGVVDVFGCGTHSQMKCRNLVPYKLARDAVRQFVSSGTLSTSVRWQRSRPISMADSDPFSPSPPPTPPACASRLGVR